MKVKILFSLDFILQYNIDTILIKTDKEEKSLFIVNTTLSLICISETEPIVSFELTLPGNGGVKNLMTHLCDDELLNGGPSW